jgi:hypothetical protein
LSGSALCHPGGGEIVCPRRNTVPTGRNSLIGCVSAFPRGNMLVHPRQQTSRMISGIFSQGHDTGTFVMVVSISPSATDSGGILSYCINIADLQRHGSPHQLLPTGTSSAVSRPLILFPAPGVSTPPARGAVRKDWLRCVCSGPGTP